MFLWACNTRTAVVSEKSTVTSFSQLVEDVLFLFAPKMSSSSSCNEYLSLPSSDLESCPPDQSEDNIEGDPGEEFIPYYVDLAPAANEEEAAWHLEELKIEIEEEQTLLSRFSAMEDVQDSHTYIVQEVRLVKWLEIVQCELIFGVLREA